MDWGQLLEVALQAVLTVALPVVLAYVAAWLKAKREAILSGLDNDTRWAVEEAARIAVRAAEQSGLAGLISDKGAEKKRFAIDSAERYLASMGLGGFDVDVIADLIEAEVWRQFGQPKQEEGE